MNRNNLAVVFSPVIFSLDYNDKKKLKSLRTQMLSNMTIAALGKHQSAGNPPISTATVPLPLISNASSNKKTNVELVTIEVNTFANPVHLATVTESPSGQFTISADLDSAMTVTAAASVADRKFSSKNSFSVENKKFSQQSQDHADISTADKSKTNYISNKINKAASSIVSFGSELGGGNKSDQAKESLENFEYMNKVVQMCVSDMIKYSMDLFTVPIENFEKLKLSVSFGSEPHNLDNLYDLESHKLKKVDFFANNVNIDKTYWSYFDKYEDVSIYYFKIEPQQQLIKTTSNTNLANTSATPNQQSFVTASTGTPLSSLNSLISTTNSSSQTFFISSNLMATVTSAGAAASASILSPATAASNASSATRTSNNNSTNTLFIPQTNECFNDKLKLWKCCTLIKKPNLTLEKILSRLKSERFLWDDDFKEGRVVEQLDDQNDLYRYVISFLPPHPSRDYFELRFVEKMWQSLIREFFVLFFVYCFYFF